MMRGARCGHGAFLRIDVAGREASIRPHYEKTSWILTLTFLLSLAARAGSVIASYEGTNSGLCYVNFSLDFVEVGRFTYSNGTNGTLLYVASGTGRYTEAKSGLRSFAVQTGTNSVTGMAFNGAVRAKSKNFVTGATGTMTCDVPR